MKRIFLNVFLVAIFFQSCQTNAPQEQVKNDMPPLETVFEEYYEERLKLFPLEATQAGDNRYNDQLPNDLTDAYQAELIEFFTRYKERLNQYDRETLPETDKVSYDVLKWECDISLEGQKFPMELMPIDQMSALPLVIGQLASGESIQPFKTVKDYEDWLGRLNSFSQWCDTAIVKMKEGVRKGYVLPKVLIEKTIPQMEAFNHGPVRDHLFFKPILNFPEGFSDSDKIKLDSAYSSMIEKRIIPAYVRLHNYLKIEYLPAGRATSGISAVPKGGEMYKHLIRYYTTTDMTADEIFRLGESEVARISSEMEKVKNQVGFEGDLKAFFEHTRTRKELMPFTEPEQVIANFEEIHNRMKPHINKLFDLIPKTPFEVRRTEAFREASASAEYNPGSQDGSRPGIFYVPIPDVKEYNMLSDEDLFLHEAIPGHHYQISLQQENEDLPKFRRTLWYSAYGEGWALYSESLGPELGLYQDPYQYFGMLSAEMHRAIRLVVDAGMHTKGWTREQAIQYSLDHEAESESGIIAEIERYMAWPGQALSYKIGQLKIIELRRRAESALGNKFDIKEFHNQVLEPGVLPIKVLEDKIDNWIASKKA
ncbi:MAG: DUF885 domain-containing protein [Bacteroidota bacterium]|nr:DUF885 domain-containing protein [Bacteroidota bacterium]